MRIQSGEFKGRTIQFTKGDGIRPTQDKVRGALFNVIMRVVGGAKVLDLFAGSGALGIEAVSRGAESATFVELNASCCKVISENIEKLALSDRARLMKMDYEKAIDALGGEGQKFDIVLADPPYYKDIPKKLLIKLGRCDILSPNIIIVIEHYKTDTAPEQEGGLVLFCQKNYSDTVLSFYRRAETGRAQNAQDSSISGDVRPDNERTY